MMFYVNYERRVDMTADLSKRQLKKEDKEKRLLEAANKLFLEKGIQNTSVSDIVKKAGVAKGTFYLYYQDKSEIEEKLIVKETINILEGAINHANKSDQTTFVELFIIAVDYIIDYLEEDKAVLEFINKNLSYAIYILNSKAKDNRFKKMYEQIYTKYKENVGPINIENPDVVVSLCIEFLGASIYSSLTFNMPRPMETLRPHLHRVVRTIFKEYAVLK